MNKHTAVSHIYIKIDNQPAGPEISGNIVEVIVDQQVHLPGMFSIRLYDQGLKLLESGVLDLAKPISIAGKDPTGAEVTLISGEITAVDPQFGEGMTPELLVRGYDNAHRLYRAMKSKSYLNVKDSDIAAQIARAGALTADVEATQTVYDHLYQHNQSDLNFLMQRAWRIGYECYVRDGKLIFRRPTNGTAALTLTWGEDLLSFYPMMTLAAQVEEVLVKGWDAQKKAAIVGRAQKGRLYPQIAERLHDAVERGQQVGQGGRQVIVDQPVVSQAEADILAAARLDELSGNFIEAEGTAFRRPDLYAGQLVKVAGVGKRFSGTYLITSATHIYTNTGFKTNFSVRGARSGLLLDQMAPTEPLARWPGVAPAIVTNTDDPNKWGRVKVKYPWLSEEDESDWARVLSAGAGPQAGFCATPAVDDEVLVTFVHGDFGQPVVVGGLWNGKDAPPQPTVAAPEQEKPLVRTWYSRTGHQITMYDNAENKVEVKTAAGHTIALDDTKQSVTVRSNGGLEILLNDNGQEIAIKAGKVSVKADSEVRVEATGNLQLKANGNLQLEAMGNLQLRATGRASLESAAVAALSAPQISLG